MPLTLYIGDRRYSSWSLRAYLVLAHAGTTPAKPVFETTSIFLDREDTTSNIAAVTSAGRVPVLHDEDLVIWDSLAIFALPAMKQWCADAELESDRAS